MADTKISALTAVVTPAPTDVIPVVQGGANKRATAAQLTLPVATAFTTTPALDGIRTMPQQTVSSVITFTAPASPTLGATNFVRLVADGTNAPLFSGFVEHGYSGGYLNVAGAVNHINFWYDGTVGYYAISQPANVSPFAAASAYVPAATPNSLALLYPYNVNGSSVPAASAFTVSASGGAVTVSSVAISSQTVTLSLSRNIAFGETVSATYTVPGTNPLLDYNGNAVVGTTTTAEVGVLPSGAKFIRLDQLSTSTETAHPSGGYDYVPTSGANYTSAGRSFSSAAIPANSDGFVTLQLQASGINGLMLGFNATSTPPATYGSLANYVYIGATGVFAYSSTATAGTTVAPAANLFLRLRRTGTTIYAETSPDNSTWTLMNTYSGSSTSTLYPCVMAGATTANNVAKRVQSSTNVA